MKVWRDEMTSIRELFITTQTNLAAMVLQRVPPVSSCSRFAAREHTKYRCEHEALAQGIAPGQCIQAAAGLLVADALPIQSQECPTRESPLVSPRIKTRPDAGNV
jgi:hypothetical protein